MPERPDPPSEAFDAFASRSLADLVSVLLRAVRDPALAYDLATEALAAARVRWTWAPEDAGRVVWLLGLGAEILDATVERKRVPSAERRRDANPAAFRLTLAHQRQLLALAEKRLDLPPGAQDVADALARTAPPPHVLRELRCSDLVDAEPLPDREGTPDGR